MSDLHGQTGNSGNSCPSVRPEHFPVAPSEETDAYHRGQQSPEHPLTKAGQSGANGWQGLPDEKSTSAEGIRLSGPVQFVLKLLHFWNLERSDAVKLLGFGTEEAEYVERLLQGKEQLHGRDVKERISNLFFIRSSLRSLFRDLNTENEWLRDRHALLDGKAPLSILLEGSLLNVLAVRDYVDTVTRR